MGSPTRPRCNLMKRAKHRNLAYTVPLYNNKIQKPPSLLPLLCRTTRRALSDSTTLRASGLKSMQQLHSLKNAHGWSSEAHELTASRWSNRSDCVAWRAAWYSHALFATPSLTWPYTSTPLFFISRAADESTHQGGTCTSLGRRAWLRWRRSCSYSTGCSAAGCTSTGITTTHRPPAARQHGISPRWRGVFLVKRKRATWGFESKGVCQAWLCDDHRS